jgi:hypothetical protein
MISGGVLKIFPASQPPFIDDFPIFSYANVIFTGQKNLIFIWQKWIFPLKSQKIKGFGNPCKVDRLIFPASNHHS